MKKLLPIILLLSILPCVAEINEDDKKRYNEAMIELAKATTEETRFYALGDAGKEAFTSGKHKEAKKHALELKKLSKKFPKNWNYGNAIQDCNLILGRLAILDDDLKLAGDYLLAAGRSPGSPQMNSFGPNMSLAKDLAKKGEKKVVVEYFKLCKVFWKMHRGKLEKWTEQVSKGEVPDFGANLVY